MTYILMIKNTLKIFFKNLIYVFVAMGIFYLFTIITIFLFATATIENLQKMLDETFALIQSATETSGHTLQDFLDYALAQIDTDGNLFDIIAQIIDTNWLQTTVKGFFETLNASVEGFGGDLTAIADNFVKSVQNTFAGAVTLLVLGGLCASYATRFVLRRKTAKRGVKKYLIAKFLGPLLQTGILVLALFVLSALRKFAILVYIGLAAVLAVIALASSWLIHRNGSIKFKDVVNAKNVVTYFVSVFLIFLICAAVAIVLFLISPLFAVLIMIPFSVYCLEIAGVSTDSFVCEMLKNGQPEVITQ